MNFKLKMPHTLVLLFALMAAAYLLTWVVPQGHFQTETTEAGATVVIPGTFEIAEEPDHLSPWDFFTAVPQAFAAAGDIIFFLLIIGGVMSLIRSTGTIDALLGQLLKYCGSRPSVLIFAVIFVFAMTSSAMGASGEYIPFVLILVALCKAMRMDPMVAVGMVVAGYGIGYGIASFNPYTVVVAQGIAEIDTYSGWALKLALLPLFVLIGVHHVWRYSRRVQADPEASLVADVDFSGKADPPSEFPELKSHHVLILAGFLTALGVAIWGISEWGWYLNELGACFLVLALFTALVGKVGPSVSAERFVRGATELAETALLVGVARGIALVMEDGQILHTIVHFLSLPLSQVGPELAAIGMLIIQSILNLFIPSGSGQAFVTMPLMAPLGDLVGVSRDISVLAFQFGDGFANMIIPTNAILMGILGMAGVPYDRWLRFCFPLFLKLMAAAALVLVVAVLAGYGSG